MVALKKSNYEHDHHFSMASQQNINMALSELNNILNMVAWGTRLSLALYSFNASVPTATNDISKLAKEVNFLSLELRQVGASLKKDRNFPSYEATRTVTEILAQSQMVFQEIESIVPVKGILDERGVIVNATDGKFPIQSWGWSQNTSLKTCYLLGHLEGLKLTLSVLLQCLYVAKITMWSRRERTQIANEAVNTERLRFQNLVIEQQMALMRVYRIYREYSLSKSAFPELPSSANQHQALIQYDEREVNPLALVPYQEPSLSKTYPARTEMEDLPRVCRIAQPYVDTLLRRWTRLEEMEVRTLEDSNSRRSSTRSDRGRWEHPTVESDSEDDFGPPRDPSRRLNGPGPILMPVNENEDMDFERGPPFSPFGIPLSPSINVHRPQIRHSWSSTSTSSISGSPYSPASPTAAAANALPRSHRSPGPSPFSSPRSSISADHYTPHAPPPSPPSSIPGATAAAVSPSHQDTPDPKNFPWRLRLKNAWWDHHGPKITGSNTNVSPVHALGDRDSVTEILTSYVVREAMEEAGLPYRSVTRDSFVDGRTRLESCFVIQRPMGWEEVRRLVARSEELRRKGREEGAEQRRRKGRGEGPLYPQPPPLGRRNSLPAGFSIGGGFGPSAAAHRHGGREKGSSRSSMESTSEEGEDARRGTSGRRRASNGGSGKDRRKSGSGSMAALGTGVAAGAGLAALLSDLAEGLGGL